MLEVLSVVGIVLAYLLVGVVIVGVFLCVSGEQGNDAGDVVIAGIVIIAWPALFALMPVALLGWVGVRLAKKIGGGGS